MNISVELPEIFPRDTVFVEGEEHRYLVYDTDSGTEPQDEYEIDKAPIEKIVTVSGTVNGVQHTFTKGTDYELSSDGERLVWLSGE